MTLLCSSVPPSPGRVAFLPAPQIPRGQARVVSRHRRLWSSTFGFQTSVPPRTAINVASAPLSQIAWGAVSACPKSVLIRARPGKPASVAPRDLDPELLLPARATAAEQSRGGPEPRGAVSPPRAESGTGLGGNAMVPFCPAGPPLPSLSRFWPFLGLLTPWNTCVSPRARLEEGSLAQTEGPGPRYLTRVAETADCTPTQSISPSHLITAEGSSMTRMTMLWLQSPGNL
nr:uncharacterized protein LOC127493739 [Oryctolagus cuniculus]